MVRGELLDPIRSATPVKPKERAAAALAATVRRAFTQLRKMKKEAILKDSP